MAIDGIDGVGGPRRTGASGKASTRGVERPASASAGDRVEVSTHAQRVADLTRQAADLPEIRGEKVRLAREAIERGVYDVDARQLARLILESEDELRG